MEVLLEETPIQRSLEHRERESALSCVVATNEYR